MSQSGFEALLTAIEPDAKPAIDAHTKVRERLRSHERFKEHHVDTFLAGSYRRRTAASHQRPSMKSRASIDDLNERLRSIQQRIANAKIGRRVLSAQLETLSLEITELEECEAALLRALDGRKLSRAGGRSGRVC